MPGPKREAHHVEVLQKLALPEFHLGQPPQHQAPLPEPQRQLVLPKHGLSSIELPAHLRPH